MRASEREHVVDRRCVRPRKQPPERREEAADVPLVEREQQLTLGVDGRERTLDVVLDTGWGRSGIVSAATLASMAPDPSPVTVWVRATDGADAEDLP